MHATIHRSFNLNSVAVVNHSDRIRIRYITKQGVQIAGMIFQTRSKARGCGIEKIKDSCEEAGNPMPEYTIKCEDIMVMFKSLVSSLVNHTNQATNQTIPNEDNSFESD